MNILLANLTKMVGDTGGLAKVTSAFANEMTRRGHQVSLVYSDEQEGEFYYSIDGNVPCYDIRHYKGGSIPYPISIKLKREFYRMFSKQKARTVNNNFAKQYLLKNLQDVLNTVKPDVIVSFQPAASKMLLLDLKTPIPVITMSHGDPEDYFHIYPKEEIPAVEQSAMNQVLLPSFAEHITNHLPNAKTIVIGNIAPQYDEQVDLLKEKNLYTIIYVGRLSKNHKRPHLLIEAFGKITHKYPQWQVELWGAEDGKVYYHQLKTQIKKLGLETRIKLMGTTKQIDKKLLAADIYVIPSAYEGFSLSMAEAMSIGLPAIGYKEAPSVNELIKDGVNGFLCEAGVEDFSKKLELLMSDANLRAKLGAQAREDMKQYAPEIIWNRWEELLLTFKSPSNE